jgi:hypothetical protein
MADDRVAFVLHRAVVVSDRAAVPTTKGAAYRVGDFGDALDSRANFGVREATDDEAMEAKQKLEADVTERVEQLRHEAAVRRRVEELRREGYRGEG